VREHLLERQNTVFETRDLDRAKRDPGERANRAGALDRSQSRIATQRVELLLEKREQLSRRLDSQRSRQRYLRGRVDLAAEAIRLGRVLAGLMPDEPEALGLLALMLLHDARRDARFSDGELVLLEDQDRGRWNSRQLAEGRALLHRASALRAPGPYVLQAGIAALQTEDSVDWRQIATHYQELARLTGSPVVELNRAVAVAHVEGPAAALAIVDQLQLEDYQYLHSTRGELLLRLGRGAEAKAAYQRALELAGAPAERRFLQARLAAASSFA